MAGNASPLGRIRRLVKQDPRSAVLLHELLGPPLGLRPPERAGA
jgi:hypothetical protein